MDAKFLSSLKTISFFGWSIRRVSYDVIEIQSKELSILLRLRPHEHDCKRKR